MSPLTALDRRIFAPVAARRVERLRMAMAVVIGARLMTTSYSRFSELPADLFSPPWFLGWLEGPPSAGLIGAVQLAGIVAALVAVAVRGRQAAPFAIAWCALLVLGGLHTSGGKIMHNDVLLILAAAPFATPALPIGGARQLVAGWQPRTAMVLVSLAYFLAGLMKLRHSGLGWVFSDNLRWVLYAGARTSRSVLPELARTVAGQLWLTVVLAAATLATEILFPLAVVWQRSRMWFAVAAIALHVGVFLFLGLDYWTWVASVAVLFLPWHHVVDRWTGERSAEVPQPS